MSLALGSRMSRTIALLWVVELAVIMLAVTVAAWLRFYGDQENHLAFIQNAPVRSFLVAIFITLSMAAFGLYQAHVRHNRMDFLLRLLLSFTFGGVGLLVLFYVLPVTYIGRGVLAISLGLGLFAVALIRLGLQHVFQMDVFKRRILVLGAGHNADLINSRLRRQSDRKSFTLLGFIPLVGQPAVVAPELQIIPKGDLLDLAVEMQAHEIVVAPDERRGGMPMEQMLACVQRGINVTDLSTFFEREADMVKLTVVDPSWLVFSGGFDHSIPRRLSCRRPSYTNSRWVAE